MKKNTYLTILALLLNLTIFSQEKIEYKLVAKATENSIVLRWAPTDANSWLMNNKYGVKIERYTLKRNNEFLDKPEKQLLTFSAIKPEELKYWEQDALKDDYVAVAAQSIYGEDFEMSNKSEDITSILNKNTELQNRFSFALLACDISVRASELSGLRYEDKTAKRGEKYLYKIISEISDPQIKARSSKLKIGREEAKQNQQIKQGEATIYLGLDDYEPLQMAPQLSAKVDDRIAKLEWNHYYYKRVFIAYYIERSTDSINFERTNKTPFTVLDVEKNNYMMQRAEILPELEKEYYYRIKGIDAFGDISPASNIIKVKGKKDDAVYSQITDQYINKENKAVIKWNTVETQCVASPPNGITVPNNIKTQSIASQQVRSFIIERSFDIKGNYQVISDSLKPEINQFTDNNSLSSNYYRVTTISKSGKVKKSFPVLLQPTDSIAPAIPKNLKASVAKTGIVKLYWDNVNDKDLEGYRVYRSRDKNGEYQQITRSSIIVNTYSDTLNLGNLDRHYWYKITSEDKRFNTSKYSELLHVIKPDTIAPPSPVFVKAKADKKGNYMQWVTSGKDLESIKLYRKLASNNKWELLRAYTPIDSTFINDYNITNSQKYHYKLTATDSVGNESLPSKAMVLTANIDNSKKLISNLTASIKRNNGEIKLSWKTQKQDIEITIYRKSNTGKPSLLKKMKNTNSFTDKEVNMGNSYKYFVKANAKGSNKAKWYETGVINY